ncbi:DUF3558 domain-containing protein [Saccharomonospora azurea]|uniref:DUF3558 domain-containing protein n=1 Tax=Saccharomonospora azurea TaxID=40988 RepID=UPI00055B8EBF|nr:DUF3558 domain-containing protein [Saccharomonospora azurea]
MKHLRAAVPLAVTALVAGCSSTPGDAAPVVPSTSLDSRPLSTALQAPTVPKVDVPLTLEPFLADPCVSLTDDQVIEYLGNPAETELGTENSSGPSCSWYSGMRSNAQISITYPRLTDEGLTAIYRNRDVHAFFDEAEPVNGYPAVSYGGVDNRDEGECLITVGTSDSDYVNIDVYLGDGSVGRVDPCDAAHEVATAVIDNIKATN